MNTCLQQKPYSVEQPGTFLLISNFLEAKNQKAEETRITDKMHSPIQLITCWSWISAGFKMWWGSCKTFLYTSVWSPCNYLLFSGVFQFSLMGLWERRKGYRLVNNTLYVSLGDIYCFLFSQFCRRHWAWHFWQRIHPQSQRNKYWLGTLTLICTGQTHFCSIFPVGGDFSWGWIMNKHSILSLMLTISLAKWLYLDTAPLPSNA